MNLPMEELAINSRRRFLSTCLGFLGAFLAGGFLYPVFSFLQPPARKKNGEIVKIPKADVPLGGMQRFHIRGIPATVINSQGTYAAFSLVCSHLGCLVTWDGAKDQFICPCHGAKFASDGHVISGPPPKGLEQLKVDVKEDEIWIS
ncbi:MAG: Rieske 2Fe-2S domain-containing protein [Deltaproteobacteria bacterium]|nr:Rieske 2Fe-2S domain-containing protein [Deltaproteobacteria bacterium]